MTWGKHVASHHRQIRDGVLTRGAMPAGTIRPVPDPMPPRKTSRKETRARTKTDTGTQVENTEVSERTLVKELGKIAP